MKLTDLQALAGKASALFDHCVIGGGAARDAFLGGPIKDIDLFVDTRCMKTRDFQLLVQALARDLGGDALVHAEGSVETQFDTWHILTPILPIIEVLPVSRCVFTDIHDYDFGVSQIQMTSAGLVYTPEFQHDLGCHGITYLKKERNERSALRLQRLRAKYPSRNLYRCDVLC